MNLRGCIAWIVGIAVWPIPYEWWQHVVHGGFTVDEWLPVVGLQGLLLAVGGCAGIVANLAVMQLKRSPSMAIWKTLLFASAPAAAGLIAGLATFGACQWLENHFTFHRIMIDEFVNGFAVFGTAALAYCAAAVTSFVPTRWGRFRESAKSGLSPT